MNPTPHKRNPFAYHQLSGDTSDSKPDGAPVTREQIAAEARALADLQDRTGQVVRHPARQLTGLYSGMASQLRKRVWNGRNLKIDPPARPPATVRNRQVAALLDRFDGLFRFWGIRYPLGLAKGRHLWSDDIAQSARLAFYLAFLPHCNQGADQCHSEELTSRKILLTPTGRIRRKVQPIRNDNGQTVGRQLKPVFRIRKEFAPTCEKAAIYALKAAKYGAMRAARKYTRNGLREVVFSSLDLRPGQSVIDYLDSIGANPAAFANAIGISSPWLDHTLQNLAECLTGGKDHISVSHAAITTAIARCEAIDGRVNRALCIANNRGLVTALFLRMAGLQWAEVADREGIKLPALKTKLHRMRAEVGRISATS